MSLFPKLIVLGAAVSVCLGADYYNQASRAGASPAEFGTESYVGTVQHRYHEWVSAQDREKLPLTHFLPDPIANWKREPWSRELEGILKSGKNFNILRAKMAEAPEAKDAGIGGMFQVNLMNGWSKKAKTSMMYFRGDEIIGISIQRTGASGVGVARQAALDVAISNIENSLTGQEVFARIRGVRYLESGGAFADLAFELDGQQPDERDQLRTIKGELGNSVRIEVRARARNTAIKALLSRIDYDGLLAQLDEEVEGVGNGVVNSLPQIKDGQTRANERQQLSEESSRKAETAMDRFLALFGITRDTPEAPREIVVNRGNVAGCAGLARDC